MRRLLLTSILALLPLVAACAPESSSSGETTTDPKNGLTITTEDFDVPAGDWFECFYTGVVTKEDLSVIGAMGKQAAGGHHILVYYVDSTKSGHAECTDAEMTSWHQVVGANGKETGEPVITLPEGVAFKLPANVQIVIQSHYINTTGETMKGIHDEVTLDLVDPATVEGYANLWTMADLGLKIPANGKATRTTQVTLKQDVPLLLFGGHMHELGANYKLELLDDKDQPVDVFYDEKWSPSYASHPPLDVFSKATPHVFKKGTKLRQTCDWSNTTPEDVSFPREMCVGFGYYYPDSGDGELDYLAQPPPP